MFDAWRGRTGCGHERCTPEPRFVGKQAHGAASVLPVASGLVVPSDTPKKPDATRFIDTDTGTTESLADTMGSAFGAVDCLYGPVVTTILEPSAASNPPGVGVYLSPDGRTWAVGCVWHRGRLASRLPPRLVQHPRLRLVGSIGGGILVGYGVDRSGANDSAALHLVVLTPAEAAS